MARFFTAPAAEHDIAEIAAYIARDNPVRALSFAKELRTRISAVAEHPLNYRERTEIKAAVRAARHGRYLIIFRIDGEIVQILRVIHGARDLEDIL